MRQNLGEWMYVLLCNTEDALANQNYPVSGSYIDVSNYTHFGFFLFAGAIDSATTIQVRQDTSATETASIKDITSASEVTGTGDSDEVFFVEVATENLDLANAFRYVTLAVSGTTGDDYGAIVFVAWNARHLPVTQPSTFPAGNRTRIAG